MYSEQHLYQVSEYFDLKKLHIIYMPITAQSAIPKITDRKNLCQRLEKGSVNCELMVSLGKGIVQSCITTNS